MVVLKMILSTILPSCFKSENKPSEPKNKNRISNQKRLLVSDLSDPGSSLSVLSDLSNSLNGGNIHIFTLAELKLITHNFSWSNYLGKGGFGPVYKGFVDDNARPGLEAQPVAVKLLDLDGRQGHREWLAEVIFLGQLRHPHLVKLIGYCCEDEHRLLVYEYVPRGSLENQLFKRYSVPLPWLTRLKIAVGAAKGLAFLHGEEQPVIYRDFKASNILLDSDYTAKLSDFGLALDGPEGDNTHVTTRIMGTEGYAAPEYIMTGHVTTKCDVFCFGVVLLELLTGKRAMDTSRPGREKNLVDWARPHLRDSHKLDQIMDPKLQGQYSKEGANKAAKLAYHCLNHHSKSRPTMIDVVLTLEPLLDLKDIPIDSFVYTVPIQGEKKNNYEKMGGGEIEGNQEKEQGINDCEEEKVVGRKEGKRWGHKNGHRHKRRMLGSSKARAVYSDTDLHTTFRNGYNLPAHHHQCDGN